MTEEQLRREMERIERDNDFAALRARVAKLEAALREIASEDHVITANDSSRVEPALTAEEAHSIARAALKDTPNG